MATYLRKAITPTGVAPAWARGIRNCIGIALPLVVGIVTGQLVLAVPTALGAYFISFSDDEGGAFRTRLRSMTLCAVVSAISFGIGIWAQPLLWLSVLLVIVWTFAWAILSSCGRIPSINGAMAATAMLVATNDAVTTFGPVVTGAAVLAGGLFVVLMTVLVWPFANALPAQREMVAARIAVEAVVANCLTAGDEANEKARQRAFAALTLARRVVAGSFPDTDRRRWELLAQLRAAERCVKLAAALRFDHGTDTSAAGDPTYGTSDSAEAERAVADLRARTTEIFTDGVDPANERTDHPLPSTAPLVQRIRAALNPSGTGFVYAVRFTIVAGAGLVLAALTRVPHASWVAVTSWRILRPSYAVTMTRAHQRVLGNVLGGIGAAILLWISPADYLLIAVIGVCSFLCFSLRSVNYGFYVVFGTVVIMMLIGLTEPGDVAVVGVRVVATIVGAVLALLGARFVLPHWTSRSALTSLTKAMAANRDYAAQIADSYRGDYDEAKVTAGRRKADDACSGAYSMLDQIRHEPVSQPQHLQLIEEVVRLNLRLRDCLVALASRYLVEWSPDRDCSVLIRELDRVIAELQQTIEEFQRHDPDAASIAAIDLEQLTRSAEELLVAARPQFDSPR